MTRFFALTLALASLSPAFAQVPDYVPTDGLVGWMDFNSNVLEDFGNATLAEDRFGNDATALELTDFLSTQFTGIGGDSSRTVCFWARRFCSGGGLSRPFVYWGANPQGTRSGYGFDYVGTGVTVDVAGAAITWGHNATYSEEAWNHYAFVLPEGSTILDDYEVYENGMLLVNRVTNYYPNTPLISTNTPVILGTIPAIEQCSVKPLIDDVGIWSRALTQDEILDLLSAPGPSPGCTDENACNFKADAMTDDGTCIPAGCLDEYACNYDAAAGCDDGSCDYSCCPGPGCCSEGMFWDWDSLACYVSKPADINMDGCVQLNDLLDLLSAYGDCATVAEWACGVPLEYQGYDYATVQIGDQCWFAENLRAESYRNGDEIPSGLTNGQWTSTSQGAITIYMDDVTGAISHIYNGYIVQDNRGVCPEGWAVPTDGQLSDLEVFAGMSAGDASATGLRGNHGIHLKASEAEYPGWIGDNLTGFSALPTKTRMGSTGEISGGGSLAVWSSTGSGDIWLRNIIGTTSQVDRDNDNPHNGRSIRCIEE